MYTCIYIYCTYTCAQMMSVSADGEPARELAFTCHNMFVHSFVFEKCKRARDFDDVCVRARFVGVYVCVFVCVLRERTVKFVYDKHTHTHIQTREQIQTRKLSRILDTSVRARVRASSTLFIQYIHICTKLRAETQAGK